jgi:hypothetical protein
LILGALVVPILVLPTFNAWGAGAAGAAGLVTILLACSLGTVGLSWSAIPFFVHPLFGVGVGIVVAGMVAIVLAAFAQRKRPKEGANHSGW